MVPGCAIHHVPLPALDRLRGFRLPSAGEVVLPDGVTPDDVVLPDDVVPDDVVRGDVVRGDVVRGDVEAVAVEDAADVRSSWSAEAGVVDAAAARCRWPRR